MTRTKLIWFFGGFAFSGLAIALLIFQIQSSHGERASGRKPIELLFAAVQGEQLPERKPPKGSGRKD